MNNVEISIDDVRSALGRGERVLLFVRHSERPRIEFDDRSFGFELALTPHGAELARTFGERLKGASDDLQFRASPLRRTMMTAELIAAGLGVEGAIAADSRIGNDSSFVSSQEDLWRLFSDGKFFSHMDAYLKTGRQLGFNPLESAASAFEEYALSHFRSQLGIFVTHDIYVAAFLHARGVKRDFCRDNWPCFLDSAAIFLRQDGTRSYALVRAGLSPLVCGVARANEV